MPWKCYVVEVIPLDPHVEDPERPRVFFTEKYRIPGMEELLSYKQLKIGAVWIGKRGIHIKLPGCSGFNGWDMEQVAREWAKGEIVQEHKWNVTGTIPNITATPSINCVGVYHGFVTNGEVTEDCEGRKFDDYGNLIS